MSTTNCFNIEEKELACKCCGLNLTHSSLLEKLRVARFFADVPFIVTSGTRCKKHNNLIGGSSTSAHLQGFAVDILVSGNTKRYKIINGLLKAGFERILIYKDFIHVDIDNTRGAPIIKIM